MVTRKACLSAMALLIASAAVLALAEVAATFTNPIVDDGQDPWVVEQDGFFYYCYAQGRGVIVHDRCSDAYSGHTMTRLGVDAVVRVSFAHYTSFEEVDRFLVALKEIVEENGT